VWRGSSHAASSLCHALFTLHSRTSAFFSGDGAGLTEDEGTYCVRFLVERAAWLRELFKREHFRFPGITPEAWETWRVRPWPRLTVFFQ